MKRTRPGSRIIFLGLLILLSFTLILFRLWNVQIVRGSEYASKINTNSQVTVRLPAVRGEILDRNGIKLVENRASFEVDFYLPDMVRAYRESKGSVPITTYRGRVHNMPRDLKEADVVKIVSETVIPRMEELGVARDYNANALQIHYRTNREVPYNYRQDLDFEEMAIFSEKNLGLAGVNVSVKPVRWYVYGSMASHLLRCSVLGVLALNGRSVPGTLAGWARKVAKIQWSVYRKIIVFWRPSTEIATRSSFNLPGAGPWHQPVRTLGVAAVMHRTMQTTLMLRILLHMH